MQKLETYHDSIRQKSYQGRKSNLDPCGSNAEASHIVGISCSHATTLKNYKFHELKKPHIVKACQSNDSLFFDYKEALAISVSGLL